MWMGPYSIFAVLMVVVGIHCVVTLVRAVIIPRRARRGPYCGVCGYASSTITRCPECGLELCQAGIVTPLVLLRLRGSATSLASALCALGMIVAVASFVLIIRWSSSARFGTTRNQAWYSPQTAGDPKEGRGGNTYIVEIERERSKSLFNRKEVIFVALAEGSALRVKASHHSFSGQVHARIQAATGQTEVFDSTGRTILRSEGFGPAETLVLYEQSKMSGFDTEAPFYKVGRAHLESLVARARKVPSSEGASFPNLNNAPGTLQCGSTNVQEELAAPISFLGLEGFDAMMFDSAVLGLAFVLLAGLGVFRWRQRLIRRFTKAATSRRLTA